MTDRIWPIGLAVGMSIVVAVNFTFIWISQQNAPDVAPSYELDPHR